MALPGVVGFAAMSGFVKDHLQQSAAVQLQPHFDSTVNAGIVAGYWTCVNAWVVRGYTKAQVDQWDRLAEYQLEIGAWFALKRHSAMMPDSVSQANLDALDRRPELAFPPKDGVVSAVLTIDGEPVAGLGTFGQFGTGPMDTSNDMFVMPASVEDDSRIGERTRF